MEMSRTPLTCLLSLPWECQRSILIIVHVDESNACASLEETNKQQRKDPQRPQHTEPVPRGGHGHGRIRADRVEADPGAGVVVDAIPQEERRAARDDDPRPAGLEDVVAGEDEPGAGPLHHDVGDEAVAGASPPAQAQGSGGKEASTIQHDAAVVMNDVQPKKDQAAKRKLNRGGNDAPPAQYTRETATCRPDGHIHCRVGWFQ